MLLDVHNQSSAFKDDYTADLMRTQPVMRNTPVHKDTGTKAQRQQDTGIMSSVLCTPRVQRNVYFVGYTFFEMALTWENYGYLQIVPNVSAMS